MDSGLQPLGNLLIKLGVMSIRLLLILLSVCCLDIAVFEEVMKLL